MRNISASQSPASHPSIEASDSILVLDSDPNCLVQIGAGLLEAGYEVHTADNGAEGLEMARNLRPALIITEVELADLSGLELCSALRADAATGNIHVIMLTARQSEMDRVLGFEFGADDYVAKPFSIRELVLRVKAAQRRWRGAKPHLVKAGPIAVDHSRCCALVNGTTIDLTPTEFRLLATLAERPNVVQTRDKLLSEVWGNENAIENRSVDTYLRRLRNKLGEAGQHIKTVYGFGYRIAC
jgi:DNA-binding response OmpR family regulator